MSETAGSSSRSSNDIGTSIGSTVNREGSKNHMSRITAEAVLRYTDSDGDDAWEIEGESEDKQLLPMQVQDALSRRSMLFTRRRCFIVFATVLALATIGLLAGFLSRRKSRESLAESPANNTHGEYWNGWGKVDKMFFFGDSYSDTRFDPNSDPPSPSNPMGNPAFPGTTSSHGPNWVDYLITEYNSSYVEAYNLAWGGTTVSWDLVPGFPMAPDFRHRVSQTFIPSYSQDSETPLATWDSENSLFAIFFGVNDVEHSYKWRNATLHDQIFEVYAAVLGQIYDAGARNFLLLNVPPIDLSPLAILDGLESQSLLADAVVDFNAHHANLTNHMKTFYNDTRVFDIDTHSLFSRVLKNTSSTPHTAMLKNTTSFCPDYDVAPRKETFLEQCWIPVGEYFWLNSLHPTWPIHEALAAEVVKVLKG